jgi:hypothetical protein
MAEPVFVVGTAVAVGVAAGDCLRSAPFAFAARIVPGVAGADAVLLAETGAPGSDIDIDVTAAGASVSAGG